MLLKLFVNLRMAYLWPKHVVLLSKIEFVLSLISALYIELLNNTTGCHTSYVWGFPVHRRLPRSVLYSWVENIIYTGQQKHRKNKTDTIMAGVALTFILRTFKVHYPSVLRVYILYLLFHLVQYLESCTRKITLFYCEINNWWRNVSGRNVINNLNEQRKGRSVLSLTLLKTKFIHSEWRTWARNLLPIMQSVGITVVCTVTQ
jgi:hypothetical protein